MKNKDRNNIKIVRSSFTKKETICAVVVTYNRKKLLLECLEALKEQTRPVDVIYIIDNSSTDGTPEILLKNNYIPKLPPSNLTIPWEVSFSINNSQKTEINFRLSMIVHYVRMHENTGGAGGFHEGVKRGYEKGHDWLWLMDDDVAPLYDGLKNMLNYSHISKCINPSKRYVNGEVISWGRKNIDISTGRRYFLKVNPFNHDKDFICINYGCFEGMLIHRNIVSKIGFPDKRFFIMGDDTIYGLLASFYTNNIYIKKVIFLKKKTKRKNEHTFLGRKSNRMPDFLFYYSIRNEFLIIEYLKKNKYFSNMAYFYILFKLLRMTLGIIIYDRSLKRLLILYKGFFNGLFKKFDQNLY